MFIEIYICKCESLLPLLYVHPKYCYIPLGVDSCSQITCYNNGDCEVLDGIAKCTCTHGFSGDYCCTCRFVLYNCSNLETEQKIIIIIIINVLAG